MRPSLNRFLSLPEWNHRSKHMSLCGVSQHMSLCGVSPTNVPQARRHAEGPPERRRELVFALFMTRAFLIVGGLPPPGGGCVQKQLTGVFWPRSAGGAQNMTRPCVDRGLSWISEAAEVARSRNPSLNPPQQRFPRPAGCRPLDFRSHAPCDCPPDGWSESTLAPVHYPGCRTW